MRIETLWKGTNALGEGPMWHVKEQALYWIDIAKPSLHRFNAVSGDYQQWPMPDFIGTVVPRAKGGVVVTVGNKIIAIDIPSGDMTTLAEIPSWHKHIRMNDGKCDRHGRLWIGVASVDVDHPQGGLFRLDPDGTLMRMEDKITISNGLGWSPDGNTFYYTDGLKYRVYQYDFDRASGSLSHRRIFLQLDPGPIEPDGLTIDSQGYVWQAQWNSGKIFRYAPDGALTQEIIMPVQRPTSCMFGGKKLVGVTGLPEPAFAG